MNDSQAVWLLCVLAECFKCDVEFNFKKKKSFGLQIFFVRYLIKNESISWQKLNEMNAMTHPHPFASFKPKKYVWHVLLIKKHVSLTGLNLGITLISATSCTGRYFSSPVNHWHRGSALSRWLDQKLDFLLTLWSKGSGSTVGTKEQVHSVYRGTVVLSLRLCRVYMFSIPVRTFLLLSFQSFLNFRNPVETKARWPL